MYYDGKPWYNALSNITENNEAKIRKTKLENEPKLERRDCAQSQTVPDQTSHDYHDIHLNPCYKQFIRILADDKK